MDRRAFIAGAAALVASPRTPTRLGAGTEVALVTADEEATARGGRAGERPGAALRPHRGEAAQHRGHRSMAVVAHSELGAVSLVRAATLHVEHVLGGFGERRYTAVHPVGRFTPPFLAHDVGWAPGGNRVWASSGDRNELALDAARSGRLLRRLAADRPPQHFTFRGDLVYVASGESGTLRVHRVGGDQLRKTIIPDDSYNVQQAHGWVVTPGLGTGTLCALDQGGRVWWQRTVARSSHDACIVTLS
jgi:hypothetical protein